MSLPPLAPQDEQLLLGRPVRAILDPVDRSVVAGERVLVTGAGGTLGAELARQIAACHPARLVLIDHAEYALFRIDRELRHAHPQLSIEPLVADVSRRADMRAACLGERPHVVFHAAAYKHVTLTERAIVPAVRTNVLGALEAALAARRVGARFVLISSDKAAQPTSVMGATKRLAELVVLGLASERFRPLAVRFGNILGSSGSLVEIMRRCVEEGRPVPVTNPDATRFFMTAGEAVSLVLKADSLGRGAQVFWLDMGDPIRIGDLVDRFLAWSAAQGLATPGIDVVGLRPGEKMCEELATQGMAMRCTEHPSIFAARQRRVSPARVDAAVRALRRAVAAGAPVDALAVLQTVVGGFRASDAAVRAAAAVQATNVRPRRPAVARPLLYLPTAAGRSR
jgi:FlaA1/EpsC-like NDP-sugar epimerase